MRLNGGIIEEKTGGTKSGGGSQEVVYGTRGAGGFQLWHEFGPATIWWRALRHVVHCSPLCRVRAANSDSLVAQC